MAEAGRAAAARGAEEGCRGGEEEAEAPGGGGEGWAPAGSAAHARTGTERQVHSA